MTDEVQQLQAELQAAYLVIGRQQVALVRLSGQLEQLREATDAGRNNGNPDDQLRQPELSGEHSRPGGP